MGKVGKSGLPIIGIIFFALAAFRFVNGHSWVVWAILGCLFGGLAVFRSKGSGGNEL